MIILPTRPLIATREISARLRKGRQWTTEVFPPYIRAPFVFNHGMGTDSSAGLVLLVGMFELGDEMARPDLILFADTGNEKRITYDYLKPMQAYLAAHNFPPVTVVRRQGKYTSLGDNCLANRTMPSIAYGGRSCSDKSKVAPMDKYINHWLPARLAWAVGAKVTKFIGYDGGKADCRRSQVTDSDDGKFRFIYPLRDAGLERKDLIAILDRAGLPQPGKSACSFCPASKHHEVVQLAETEPDLLAEALLMEARAMRRTASEKVTWSTMGLGRNWAWREFLAKDYPAILAEIEAKYDTGAPDWAVYQSLRRGVGTP
jgi:hypothetical protein